MFPFSQGINEFQAMTVAGSVPARALKAATAIRCGAPATRVDVVMARGHIHHHR
jgi:hypothetical protein